jgi:hypothetical protein
MFANMKATTEASMSQDAGFALLQKFQDNGNTCQVRAFACMP